MTHPRLRLQIFTSQGNRLFLFSLQSSRDRLAGLPPSLKIDSAKITLESETGKGFKLLVYKDRAFLSPCAIYLN